MRRKWAASQGSCQCPTSPNNRLQATSLEDWGANGVTERLSVTVPVTIAGRTGYHSLTVIGSSKRGTDLSELPQLLLPPEAGAALGTKKGSYYVGYSVQQYLWEDPHTPGAGWGLFGVVVRTAAGRTLWERLETALFDRLPGYALVRSLAQQLAGNEEEHG